MSSTAGTALSSWGRFCAVVVMLVGAFAGSAAAERRVALVIGNGGYAKVPELANATNDARAIELLLKKARFDKVVRVGDLGASAMKRAMRDFSDEVRDADVAVFFYAGHGIEMQGTNYLVPVDAVLERDIDVADETVSLDRVNQVLEPAKRLRLIILDACRDNPFMRSMRRTLAGRAIGRGLAPVEVTTTDTLIAYAAKAGSTAADGEGANSPYTAALVAHLATPGLDVRLALGRVRDDVLHNTGRRQEPFVYGSLGGSEISLVPGKATESPPAPAASQQQDTTERAAAAVWASIKDSKSTAELEAFIEQFGATFHARLARQRIDELKSPRSAVATPPKAPGTNTSPNSTPALEFQPTVLRSTEETLQLLVNYKGPTVLVQPDIPKKTLNAVRNMLEISPETTVLAIIDAGILSFGEAIAISERGIHLRVNGKSKLMQYHDLKALDCKDEEAPTFDWATSLVVCKSKSGDATIFRFGQADKRAAFSEILTKLRLAN